jgi:CPA2 family monovalent cation:H+ antiporter-2
MHLIPLIQDLAVILAVGGLAAFIFQRMKQPLVLGYLVSGIIVGPNTPPFSWVTDLPGIQTWSELGMIFMMFGLGLEFGLKKLLRVGVTPAVTGPFEAIFMMGAGYIFGKFAGWSSMDCLFLGGILSVSSTAIIIKALNEMKLKSERFAELVFGILVVEDLMGILILVFLSGLGEGKGTSGSELLWVTAKLFFILCAWFAVGQIIIVRFANYVGRKSNDETLTVLSLGLCLSSVVLASYFHYSAALGAFMMGSILAGTSIVEKIEKLMSPLRDVFGAIFFVSVGMLLNPKDLATYWLPIVLISILTIVGKVASTAFGSWITGQPKEVSVKAGLAMGQIGEFSFIIAALGLSLGVMSPFLYPIAVSVSVITTFTTPYLIQFSRRIVS